MHRGPRRLEIPEADRQYWLVAPQWEGKTAAILGGGPSLTQVQCDAVREARLRVIAVNNSYQLAPWAEYLYFSDAVWWQWHQSERLYRDFAGRKVTLDNRDIRAAEPGMLGLKNLGKVDGMCRLPYGVHTGSSSGYQALNLCWHLGVKRVLLLGFDMRVVGRRTHWHMAHKRPTAADVFQTEMIPAFRRAVPDLKEGGLEVINCTPESALDCFPRVALDEALAT